MSFLRKQYERQHGTKHPRKRHAHGGHTKADMAREIAAEQGLPMIELKMPTSKTLLLKWLTGETDELPPEGHRVPEDDDNEPDDYADLAVTKNKEFKL